MYHHHICTIVLFEIGVLIMSDGDHDSNDLDWDDVARVPDEYEGCFAIASDHKIAKPKRSYELPQPTNRTKEQHHLAAHIMRESAATMTSRRVKQQSEEQASNAIALLLDFVFLLDRRVKIKQVRSVVSIVGADRCRRFPASTAQQTWRRHLTAIHRWSLKHARFLHVPLS